MGKPALPPAPGHCSWASDADVERAVAVRWQAMQTYHAARNLGSAIATACRKCPIDVTGWRQCHETVGPPPPQVPRVPQLLPTGCLQLGINSATHPSHVPERVNVLSGCPPARHCCRRSLAAAQGPLPWGEARKRRNPRPTSACWHHQGCPLRIECWAHKGLQQQGRRHRSAMPSCQAPARRRRRTASSY